jgi:hypothetical protein
MLEFIFELKKGQDNSEHFPIMETQRENGQKGFNFRKFIPTLYKRMVIDGKTEQID